MTEADPTIPRPAGEALCSVVLICEDAVAHDRARALCDNLARQFWGNVEFDCKGWLFSTLKSAESAFEAAAAAATAGLVVFAIQSEGDLPEHIQSWVESWVGRRSECEGALISLVGPAGTPQAAVTPKQMYLRQVARRARMDFMSDLSQAGPRLVPDSMEWFETRADCLGNVMDDILKESGTPHPPSGRGGSEP